MRPDVSWDDLPPGWTEKPEVVFVGEASSEARQQEVIRRLGELPRAESVKCTYAPSTFGVKLGWSDTTIEGDVRNVLVTGIADRVRGKVIVIDITTLPHPLFLALVKTLRELKPTRVFCTYAEPEDYPKRFIAGEEEFRSALSEGFESLRVLPTLVQEPGEGEEILITFLGFEGDRLKSLLENEDYGRLVPIIGFPAYRPGWHLRTLKENYRYLLAEGHQPIRIAEAASPFQARDVVLEIARENQGCALKVAIIGTRPHALGALLAHFASPAIRLIYDHPLEKSDRTIGIAQIHVYDVSRDLGCAPP